MSKKRLSLALLVLWTPLAPAQTVWTVDDDGPADFSTLLSATTVASDGDTLVVEAGSYDALLISGKGLNVIGRGNVECSSFTPFPSIPQSPCVISNLPKGSQVSVRGVRFRHQLSNPTAALQAFSNQGAILIEDCDLDPTGDGIDVRDTTSLTLQSIDVHASGSVNSWVDSLDAVFVTARFVRSNVWIYDSDFQGGHGGAAYLETNPFAGVQVIEASNAGDAIHLEESTLFVQGSRLRGGDGAVNPMEHCSPGGNGGSVIVLDALSSARVVTSELTPGSGGTASCGQADGLDGVIFAGAGAAQVVEVPGVARTRTVGGWFTPGTAIDVQLNGGPLDAVIVALSPGILPAALLPDGLTVHHLLPPKEFLWVGLTDASGSLQVGFQAPPLEVGVQGANLFHQFWMYDGVSFFETGPGVLNVLSDEL